MLLDIQGFLKECTWSQKEVSSVPCFLYKSKFWRLASREKSLGERECLEVRPLMLRCWLDISVRVSGSVYYMNHKGVLPTSAWLVPLGRFFIQLCRKISLSFLFPDQRNPNQGPQPRWVNSILVTTRSSYFLNVYHSVCRASLVTLRWFRGVRRNNPLTPSMRELRVRPSHTGSLFQWVFFPSLCFRGCPEAPGSSEAVGQPFWEWEDEATAILYTRNKPKKACRNTISEFQSLQFQAIHLTSVCLTTLSVHKWSMGYYREHRELKPTLCNPH